MKIIAHRGWWQKPLEKNSLTAFVRALENGFGIETDIRDYGGKLLISHDCPTGNEMTFGEFLQLCKEYLAARPLALNIKCDGLNTSIKTMLDEHVIKDAFVFDMSIPDALGYLNTDIPVYTRLSEYENPPPFLDQAKGIWLDAFYNEWYGVDLIKSYLNKGKAIAIVSPELHRRPHSELWQKIKIAQLHHSPQLSLCTDFPQQALEFFHG